jgi:predicted nucleic-acid-binding Zn-ribbon protein
LENRLENIKEFECPKIDGIQNNKKKVYNQISKILEISKNNFITIENKNVNIWNS